MLQKYPVFDIINSGYFYFTLLTERKKTMKITVICVGKLKEKYLKEAVSEYSKRLHRFCDFSYAEVSDEKIPDNASSSEEAKIKKVEGERIKKYLNGSEYIISLCVEGKQISSEEFAEKISSVMNFGKSKISFVIGGSLGLSDDIKAMSDFKLSFSRMTFPHQLMRVILSEQIYRCFKINSNEKYHK